MMVKVFCETFKNVKNPPALIMKTSGATFSIIDREEILKKVKVIKDSINAKSLPNVYVLHGDFKDEEMNQLYNHPKVKAHLTFTHGEGFGRPLLEASFSGKPILAPLWSGQKDFLNKDYIVELPHTLTKVPKSAFPKEFSNNDAYWATVNYALASKAIKNVYDNYDKFKLKGKKLMIVNRELFSHEAMKEKLEKIIDKELEGVSQPVKLTLPKLKKKGSSSQKSNEIKLPKLKKV
jgi:glycosyltransferase involved in cell wall biosynthesis